MSRYTDKESQRASNRRYYGRNKQLYRDKNIRRRDAIRELVRSKKRGMKCSRCPENDPRCLDFHHVDPNKKLFTIAMAVNLMYSLKRVAAEIEKCILLCANCHRKETLETF